MAEIDLAALDALHEKVTKGPWTVEDWEDSVNIVGDDQGLTTGVHGGGSSFCNREDAAFIVALVNNYPQLRAERQKLITQKASLQADLIRVGDALRDERGEFITDKAETAAHELRQLRAVRSEAESELASLRARVRASEGAESPSYIGRVSEGVEGAVLPTAKVTAWDALRGYWECGRGEDEKAMVAMMDEYLTAASAEIRKLLPLFAPPTACPEGVPLGPASRFIGHDSAECMRCKIALEWHASGWRHPAPPTGTP